MRNFRLNLDYNIDNQIVKIPASYVTEGCVHFFNAQHLHLQLSPIERCYFEFMCERMDYQNRLNLKPIFREDFILHFKNLTKQKPPSDRMLSGCEKKLKGLNLILKIKGQGSLHFANPKYVSKGTQTLRKKSLQLLADYALVGKVDIAAIIDRSLEKILEETKKNV